MTRYLLGATLFALIAYGLIKAGPLLAGPSLSVVSPVNNETVPGGTLVVEGNVARAAILKLNGATLLHDQRGEFSSTLTFPHGGSILTFVATDRFGRTVTVTRSIFVK